MADKSSGSGGPSGIGDRPQDDFVARNPSDPSERPPRTPTLSGLLGDSDRASAGFRRLHVDKQFDDDCFTHRGHSVCGTGVCNG
ncbi:hypothetical protein AB0D10_35455 [Kitasatospora sp. NPDC048545]|uniref:hypothetical protein n=1 Tax=Kitasatospora sp. NPDC048545 TaxID=3157208 RepID=UPI0033D94B0A